MNKLDVLSVLVCGVLFALLDNAMVSHQWTHEGSALFGLALSVRLFRLANIFTFYEGHFRIILYTVVDILPAIANVFFMLFAAVYIFAVAATDLYAGVLDPKDPVLRNATGAAAWEAYGHELTFDNVPSSLFTLFQVSTQHVVTLLILAVVQLWCLPPRLFYHLFSATSVLQYGFDHTMHPYPHYPSVPSSLPPVPPSVLPLQPIYYTLHPRHASVGSLSQVAHRYGCRRGESGGVRPRIFLRLPHRHHAPPPPLVRRLRDRIVHQELLRDDPRKRRNHTQPAQTVTVQADPPRWDVHLGRQAKGHGRGRKVTAFSVPCLHPNPECCLHTPEPIHRAMLCPTAPTTLSHTRRAGSAWPLTRSLFSLSPPSHYR